MFVDEGYNFYGDFTFLEVQWEEIWFHQHGLSLTQVRVENPTNLGLGRRISKTKAGKGKGGKKEGGRWTKYTPGFVTISKQVKMSCRRRNNSRCKEVNGSFCCVQLWRSSDENVGKTSRKILSLSD